MDCQAVTQSGERCNAHALVGKRFCFQHEPTVAGERLRARRLGGLRRGSHAGDARQLPEKTRTVEDVLSLLDYTRDELLACDNGVPRARALIALAGEYIHALELASIERRIEALERQAK